MTISPIASSQQLTPHDTQRQAKLADAAHQFEGMFLQELLKPMQSKSSLTGNSDDKSGDDSDDSADTLQTYATEAVARAISAHGGFGIARQVIQQLNQSSLEHQNNQKNLTTP